MHTVTDADCRKSLFLRIFVIAVPVAAAALCAVFAQDICALEALLPQCFLRSRLGLWCPACGNTRAVQHLLSGDIIGSLRYNITPAVLIIIAGLFWTELIFFAFGKRLRLYPRRPAFSYILLCAMLAYYVLRNFIPAMRPL